MLVPSSSLRAAITAHTPLRFDPTSAHPHEPFVPIAPPPIPKHPLLTTLKLTPPRPEDAPILLATLNDPTVFPGMRSIPYPLQLEGVAVLLEKARVAGEEVLGQWERGEWGRAADAFPFSAIRGVGASGGEEWIGGLSLRRWPYDEVDDPEEKARKVEEMKDYDNNDPRILRTMGCKSLLCPSPHSAPDANLLYSRLLYFAVYLHPSHQGLGIMSLVLRAFIDSYLVPVVHAHHLRATVYTWNRASRRVFEKCGWRVRGSNWVNTGPGRGERRAEEWWIEWRRDEKIESRVE